MSLLKDQIAVITGAGRGIGQAIAAKFASEGADVVCVELKNEFAEQTAQKVKEAGRKSWIF
jgi:NAD(P)-dependent dehydrogenase (short-subunit alcohol dehydrogenase family)